MLAEVITTTETMMICPGTDSCAGNFTDTAAETDEDSAQLFSDLTRDIFYIVNYCIVGFLLNIVGTIANIINIVVFVKMGFAETVNISLLGLAVSDLCALVTIQWLNLCYNPLVRYSDLPFDSFEISYLTAGWPHVCSARITGLITAYITFERCLSVTLPLKVKSILTPSRTVFTIVSLFIITIAPVVPIYFVNLLEWKFFPSKNKSLVGLVFTPDTEYVESIVFAISNALGYISFIIVVTCTAILIHKLKSNSKWRQSAQASKGDGEKSASSSRERRVVVMVSMISGVFIFCFLPKTMLHMAVSIIPGFSIMGTSKYSNMYQALSSIAFVLEQFNSSINFFIYMKMSSKFRSTFNTMVGKKDEKDPNSRSTQKTSEKSS